MEFWNGLVSLFTHITSRIWNLLFVDMTVHGIPYGAFLVSFVIIGTVLSFFFRGDG